MPNEIGLMAKLRNEGKRAIMDHSRRSTMLMVSASGTAVVLS